MLNEPGRILFSTHHLSHAASAYFPSPFDAAAILTLDGVGEWATTSVAMGEGARISFLKEIRFPHSLGILYSAFTAFLGFKPNSGEYKVMGLAPFGTPKFTDSILQEIVAARSGSVATFTDNAAAARIKGQFIECRRLKTCTPAGGIS